VRDYRQRRPNVDVSTGSRTVREGLLAQISSYTKLVYRWTFG